MRNLKPMNIDKTQQQSNENYPERRQQAAKIECLKLDTFTAINTCLTGIKAKLDDLSDEMRIMARLEERIISQNGELARINAIIEQLQIANTSVAIQIIELRSNFESQKKSIGTFERVVWGAATCAAIIIGKFYFGVN